MSRLLTALLAFVLAVLALPPAAAAAAPAPGRTIASDWKETLSSRKGRLAPFSLGVRRGEEYTSPAHRVAHEYYAVGAHWKAAVPRDAYFEVYVRTSEDGTRWGRWLSMHDDHGDPQLDRDGRTFGPLIVGQGRYVQYKVKRTPSARGEWPRVDDVTLTSIDSTQGPTTQQARATASSDVSTQALAKPAVISRAGWGANESYRYDSSGEEKWNRKYLQVTKAVMHETVTRNRDTNPAATVRSIYYYHAVTRGWGDIGYNYLIDDYGNIYEGRAGGENVVAGHTGCYNHGTIGIAALGDYAKVKPTDAMVAAHKRLIAWKFDRDGIDPTGRGVFMKNNIEPLANQYNIMAHRDATIARTDACPSTHVDPGPYLYDRMPEIRQAVLAALGYKPTPQPAISDVVFAPSKLNSGGRTRVEVTVRNNGTGLMETQGAGPGATYKETDTWTSLGYAKVPGKFRVFADYTGNRTSVPAPFRWGLTRPLLPGQSRVITGFVNLSTLGDNTWWVGLNQEDVAQPVARAGDSTVSVVASGSADAAGGVILGATTSPSIISPNGDGKDESSSLTYSLSSPQQVKIEQFSSSGRWMKTLQPWTSVAAGVKQQVAVPGTSYNVVRGSTLPLDEDNYVLAVTAKDASGAVREASVPLIVDVSAPTAANVAASPALFSPNGDGALDSTRFTGSFSETVSWALDLRNSAGSSVRRVTGSGSTLAWVWDGKTASGALAPNGSYTYTLSYTDRAGFAGASATGSVALDTVRPVVSSPAPSGTGPYTVSYKLSESVTMEPYITDAAGAVVRVLNASSRQAGANTSSWNGQRADGTYASPGTHYWNLPATDLAGNRTATTTRAAFTVQAVTVTVDNTSAGFTVSSKWSTGSYNSPYGTDYRWRYADGSSADRATWSAALGAGTYDVFAWYTSGTNRSTKATYSLGYSGGTKAVTVDQRTGGGAWKLLGSVSVTTTGTYKVTLSAPTGASGVVIADAVKWVRK
jgi:flagellar hook assembly protein FlgD